MSESPVIEIKGLRKTFGGNEVLKGVDLSIMEGRTTVIVGASGQGKSLIVKHILGLMRPDSGSVKVYGKEMSTISKKDLKEIRADFGVLFQNSALFDSMSVYDNIALPLRERTRMSEEEISRIVNDKIELMDIAGSNEKYPAQISGGMKKRVGLARALVLKPRIIFFDEPTTGLDVAKSNELYRIFFRTQQKLKYTAVIVSHDVPKIFKLADYVALLNDGIIQGCLPPEEFQLSDDPVIRGFVETTMGPRYSGEMEV